MTNIKQKNRNAGIRETLKKGKALKFKNGEVGQPGFQYIQATRIDPSTFNNGRKHVAKAVTEEWARTFATEGQVTPVGVVKLKTIDPITGQKMVGLKDGGRRWEAIQRNITQEWYGIENPAMQDEEGTVWVAIHFLDHVNFTDRVEDLFFQLKTNSHNEWDAFSMIAVSVELIDDIGETATGEKITAEMVSSKIGKARETVQTYLKIGRTPGMMEIMETGKLPATVSVLKYVAALVQEETVEKDSILFHADNIAKEGHKVTVKRLSDALFPEKFAPEEEEVTPTQEQSKATNTNSGNSSLPIIEEKTVASVQPKQTAEATVKTDAGSETSTRKTRYNLVETIESCLARIHAGHPIRPTLELLLEAKEQSMDVDELVEEIEKLA